MAFLGCWCDNKAEFNGGGSLVTWRLCAVPSVWAIHFLAIYGFTAVACERRFTIAAFDVNVIAWFIGTVTLMAALMLAVTIRLTVRDARRTTPLPALAKFVHWLTIASASLVLVALVWETLPILFVPICL